MAIDGRARQDLFTGLDEVLGPQRAETLMAHLPPVGWADVATKQDLTLMRQDLVVLMKQDLVLMRQDLVQLEERMNMRFEMVDQRMDAMKFELMAAFRGEIVDALSSQTRTIILSMLGAVLTVGLTAGSLMLAAAKLG